MIKDFKNFKINESSSIKEDSWKDVFIRQTASGRYWKNLFKEDFEKHKFLDRSDAVWICKKSQSDGYDNIIELLDDQVDEKIIDKIKKLRDELWEDQDDSALGM